MSIKPNAKTRDSRLSKIQQKWLAPRKPFVTIYVDDLESKEWRFLDALTCQLFQPWHKSNGELQVSYSGFERAGITSRRYVADAKNKLAALGLITVTQSQDANQGLKPQSI